MRHIISLVLMVSLMGCEAATLKVTKLKISEESTKGVVYRLPEPRVQITMKQYKTTLYKSDREYSAAVVALPSDNYVYEIQQHGGTITKDGVTITMGDGGTLDSYNLTSAQQTTEIIKEVGTLVASIAAAAAGLPPKEIIARPEPTEEDRRLKEYNEDLRERTLQALDQLKKKPNLSADEATQYQLLTDKLASLQQKLTPELALVTDVQMIQIEIVSPGAMSIKDYLKAWQEKHAMDGDKRPRFVAVARRIP